MKKLTVLAAFLMVFFSFMSCKNNVEEQAPETEAMENMEEEVVEEVTQTAEKFSSELNWGNEDYKVTATTMGTQSQVIIQPTGAIANQGSVNMTYEGKVTGAEIGDLNGDNHAEVLVYLTSGANNMGSVIAVSSNNGKSISPIYMVQTAQNSEINKGYNGGDQFAIVENSFTQRFPIYENGAPTGKTRQVTYKVQEGEGMRQLKVVKVNEY